jgi:hypothetical protein
MIKMTELLVKIAVEIVAAALVALITTYVRRVIQTA